MGVVIHAKGWQVRGECRLNEVSERDERDEVEEKKEEDILLVQHQPS